MKTWRWILVAVLGAGTALGAAAQGAPGGYRVSGTIPIGGEGGWDYLTADPLAHRLYVSHGTRVQVVDTTTNAVVGEIPDTPGVHGIAVAPELGRGFTSNGRAATVTVFDLKSLAAIATVKVTGENPDAIAYDAVSRRVFTFNGRGHNATAIDAEAAKVVGTLELDGKPEAAVADGKGRMYVNLEDKSEVVAFDARTLKVEGRWPLAPCEEPSGLAIDRAHRRLFAGCHNQVMAVIDAENGHVLTSLPIGRGVDGAAFDPQTGFAFTSNGDGTLTVVREDSPEKFTLLGNVPTKRGARTLALDEATHRIYLSTAQFGPPPSPTAEHPHPRPSILPGTFEVLIVQR
jgi:DNA-binding beta-propeller fold protein YncE